MSTPASGAIVFTDIVGFTELCDLHGDDVALQLVDLQTSVVQQSLPADARIVKELGDGLLIWIGDPCAAVTFSIGLQPQFDSASTHELPIWVRTGAHWGSPRARGDDLIGRDVNLASRIAALAGPGEVLCSQVLADAAAGSEALDGVRFDELGPAFVRGVADPVPLVRAYR